LTSLPPSARRTPGWAGRCFPSVCFDIMLPAVHLVTAILAAMARKPFRATSKKAASGGGFGAPKKAAPTFDEVIKSFPTRLPSDFATAPCPCGSSDTYAECCRPYHAEESLPESPERCLRTRYSAFAYRLPAYIITTTDKVNSDYSDDKVKWARRLHKEQMFDGFRFEGLEIGDAEPGRNEKEKFLSLAVTLMPIDKKTKLPTSEQPMVFYEKSKFKRNAQGAWLYATGEVTTDAVGFKGRVLNNQKDVEAMGKDVEFVKKIIKTKGGIDIPEADDGEETEAARTGEGGD
jgi:SEC-C motif-containing protein